MAEATTTLATAHFIEIWRTQRTTIALLRMGHPTNLDMSSVKSMLVVFKRTLVYKNPTSP
jgi:hypothetical protein